MSVSPLSDFDFLSRAQFQEKVAERRLLADCREAARSREAAGLVSLKTSQPSVFEKSFYTEKPTCWTGVYHRNEFSTAMPAGVYPSNPDSLEIDQRLMRLRRLKKNVLTSARYHSKEAVGFKAKPVMVTLTYRDNDDWQPKDISSYLSSVKKYFNRRGHVFRYVWVFELTKRGRPHYHVLVWMPRGITMPKADKRGWWPHGMTRTEWARHAVGYIAKYASKGSEDVIPKGVRLYGVGGLSDRSRVFRAWWNLPVSVRRWGLPYDFWRRSPGGGWVCRRTGEWRPSQWRVLIVLGRVFVLPLIQPIASPLDQLLQSLSSTISRIGS